MDTKKGLHSIWENTQYMSNPVPTWAFEVDFSNYFINEDNSDYYASILNKSVATCTWPSRDGNTIDVYYVGIQAKLPRKNQCSQRIDNEIQ